MKHSTTHSTIEAFGLRLRRLTHSDIETVRKWRNSESVRQFMAFRGEISPEMQEVWFAKLDPAQQYFYVIETDGRDVGLVSLKNINNNVGEGGIFIAEQDDRNGTLGLRAILALYDFGFEVLGLERIIAHILRDNRRAIRFNQALGFVKQPRQEEIENQLWEVSLDGYMRTTRTLREYFNSI